MSPRTFNAPRDMAAQRQRLRWSRLRRRVAPLLSKLFHLAVLSALCLSDLAGLATPTPVRAADSSPPGLTQRISIHPYKSFALQHSADLTATPEPTSLPFVPNPLPLPPIHSLKRHSAGLSNWERRGCAPCPHHLPRLRGRPARPLKHSAIKRACLCFPSNAYCEKKRSGGTNCRGPTYASIWGMRDVSCHG